MRTFDRSFASWADEKPTDLPDEPVRKTLRLRYTAPFSYATLAMLNSVQTLRALAAWLVVLHHYMQLAHNFTLTDPVSTALHMYGAIGVDLFFIISGFVIYISAAEKQVTPATFAVHRLARIAPAYWIFTLATAAALLVSPSFVPLTQFEPLFLLKSLLFIPAQNPSGIGAYPLITVGWTLNYEMAFYGIFLLSFYGPKTARPALIALGLFLLCKLVPHLGGDFAFYDNPIIYEFLFGILIAIAHQKGWVKKIPPLMAIALVVIALGLIIHNGQVEHKPMKSGFPCALILLAAVSLERFFSRRAFMAKLGDWSYSTYLCHVLVISAMTRLHQWINLNDVVTFTLIAITILAVSYTSFTFIEKPISKLAKRNFRGSMPAPASAA
ncbi:acyltransferase [Pseudomonas batumici]|uniref:acyltransferase family protein n=1 Tax=Pseudomonas batumici TaxID=226910 RepID=UPI0030CBE142